MLAELHARVLADGLAGDVPPTIRGGPQERVRLLSQLLEARLHQRLPPVTLRTDAGAAERARKLGARAYAEGTEVGFAADAPRPGTRAGDRLVVHELVHVWQQTVSRSVPPAVQLDAQPSTPTVDYYARLQDLIGQLLEQARSSTTAPQARAPLEREAVILMFTAPQTLSSQEALDALDAEARQAAQDEDATVAYFASKGVPVNEIQLHYPIAFPRLWSKLVYDALDAHIDVERLNRAKQDKYTALKSWADRLPAVIVAAGVPVSKERALSGKPIQLELGLTESTLAPDHPVVAFARGAGGYSGALAVINYLISWQQMAVHIRDTILSGEHTVDPDAYQEFAANSQAILAGLPKRIEQVGLFPKELNELNKTLVDLSNVELVRSFASFYIGLVSIFAGWDQAKKLFDSELRVVDGVLGKLDGKSRCATAFAWSYFCGYLAAAAKAEWEEILAHGVETIVSTVLGAVIGFILIQFIPGIDLAFDLAVLIMSGAGVIEAGHAIYAAFMAAAEADNVEDMQRASARLADVLVGDGLKLIKDLIMLAGSMGGIAGKMGKYQRAGATREDAFRRAVEEESRPVKGTKMGGGPKKEPGPAYVRKPPTKAELELVAKMQAERIARGLDKISIKPLRAYLEKAPTSLQEIAADSPAMMEDSWRAFQERLKDPDFKTREFGQYLRTRMRAERGRLGEFMEGFLRGPEEIMAYAPKQVTTEAGLDMITYTNKRRINLIDNKAFKMGSRVSKVSAFEKNLPQNMRSVIAEMETYAARPGVPPELNAEVLPRLRAAERDVSAEFAKELAANPKADLYDVAFQKRISTILDGHGIDRVVTLSGSGQQVTVSPSLLDRLSR